MIIYNFEEYKEKYGSIGEKYGHYSGDEVILSIDTPINDDYVSGRLDEIFDREELNEIIGF